MEQLSFLIKEISKASQNPSDPKCWQTLQMLLECLFERAPFPNWLSPDVLDIKSWNCQLFDLLLMLVEQRTGGRSTYVEGTRLEKTDNALLFCPSLTFFCLALTML